MIGQTVSHYKILEKLGEGGMGVVYKAQDTRLDRTVALKFLPEHLLSDPTAKARFIHEAKGASAINHQNITTVYDIGEVDGKSFIAMEYLEGKTVKELAKENLKLTQILEIAIQIAEGLAAAHEKEIVHRDIKSENIMVTKDNAAKIMDFGLAKLKGAAKLTQSGATPGTIAYMSPEQTRGEEIDHRSDIFSSGVVLYELLTGRLPFQGDHNAAIIYSISYEEPEPLARYKSNLPESLQRIIDKSLKKDKKIRYQSVDDLLSDLKGLQKEVVAGNFVISPKRKTASRVVLFAGIVALLLIGGYLTFFRSSTTNAKKPMLAVLPFRNLGPPEQEYFADGITDEITTNLAKISGLGVISNTSAIQYKEIKKNLREIGKELGADYVLEGTVRKEKDADTTWVRINPQLIRVKDDTHIWAETYERVFNQVFAVQSDIAVKVAQAMNVVLFASDRESLKTKPTDNAVAYDYFLRGNDYLNRGWDKDTVRIAMELYKKARALDPDFDLTFAKISEAASLSTAVADTGFFHIAKRVKEISYALHEDSSMVTPSFVSAVIEQINLFKKWKKPTQLALYRGKQYLPFIMKTLKKKRLPVELAYIAFVESRYGPVVKSPAGAVGLWQLTIPSARRFGLKIDQPRNIDERTDPNKSTEAATGYLNFLIRYKGSIFKALASYNMGEESMLKATLKVEDYLSHSDYFYLSRKGLIPSETRDYVPRFLAVVIISTDPSRFGFTP